MRTWPSWGLLLLATLTIQASTAQDLYWEGEEDASNEFLEVKDDALVDHLKRFKRDWLWNPFSSFSSSTTTTPAPETNINTEDPDSYDLKDDDDHAEGSGSAPAAAPSQPDGDAPGEKTLRVTFVVMQPYQEEYSNRDSPEFQKFSTSMAQAVNALFEDLPGTQKASLIRIQSRLADNFSCKVTMEIVTIGYEDTDQIRDTLRNYIRSYGYMDNVVVKDDDFSANVVNPGSPFQTCESDQIQCDDGFCIPESARCDGVPHCSDNSDEQGCPLDGGPNIDQQANEIDSDQRTHQSLDRESDQDLDRIESNPDQVEDCVERIPCASSSVTICKSKQCDGTEDCPSGDDEDPAICSNLRVEPQGTERGDQELYITVPNPRQNEIPGPETTPRPPSEQTCLPGEFRCDDNSRCIPKSSRCDQRTDCLDGTDEANCPGVGFKKLCLKADKADCTTHVARHPVRPRQALSRTLPEE